MSDGSTLREGQDMVVLGRWAHSLFVLRVDPVRRCFGRGGRRKRRRCRVVPPIGKRMEWL